MKITSSRFMQGIIGDTELLRDGKPQVAFIGRSNAGKSTLISTLCGNNKLTKSSKSPGRTREINIFLINEAGYFLDLPGYGFAKASAAVAGKLYKLIHWYLFHSGYDPVVVLVVDALVGPTVDDLQMLESLEQRGKDVVIVLNKVDKVKKSQRFGRMKTLTEQFSQHSVFPVSSKEKIGIDALREELLS